jgi:lysozyme family protein
VFDCAVNSGPGRAAMLLQQAIGVWPDGVIGPKTMAAIKATDAKATVDRFCDLRLAFLRGLPTWPTFGKGWERRVEDVRRQAKGMVG